MNIYFGEAIHSPHAHFAICFVINQALLGGNTSPKLFLKGGWGVLGWWAPSAMGCPACCCSQEQEGTIGRLCIGWSNTSISYLPLHCNPQPSSLLQTGCAAWWLTVQMQLKGRHGVSAGHAVEVRAVLQFSYFPVCQLHTSGMFELELWLCTGTEEMLCIWKSDIQYFVCVSSKSASTQAKMLLKRILLTGCFQDFPYSFALFFVSSLNLEALEL